MSNSSLDLFDNLLHSEERSIERVERILFAIADKAYTSVALKPMSKVLFLVSRSLLALNLNPKARSKADIVHAYQTQCNLMGETAPFDDYSFSKVLDDAGVMLDSLIEDLSVIREEVDSRDKLGLAFDTLIRGRWESGEGLGTFLTPEEVVTAIVEMMLECKVGFTDSPRIADICAGTGRFVRKLVFNLREKGINNCKVSLYDQSSMSISLARLTLFFDEIDANIKVVHDSLIDNSLTKQLGGFDYLATNPPFGMNKYTAIKKLWKHLPYNSLSALGIRSVGDVCDPASLFLIRNLLLLAPTGVLGIVLPDGVLQSKATIESIKSIEDKTTSRFDLLALVSLPAHTFNLGGTVAKTSFTLFQRNSSSDVPAVFVAEAKHVGFLKRGNRRVVDPDGNDLLEIVECFRNKESSDCAAWSQTNWRSKSKISPAALLKKHLAKHLSGTVKVSDRADLIRESIKAPDIATHAHISVIFVDSMGTIDIAKALRYRPATAGFRCQSGDILVSCINPRKWRVALIPNLKDITWSCSSEFAVLRPRSPDFAADLFIQLMQKDIAKYVSKLVNGTSSSRQRVQKEQILGVPIKESSENQILHLMTILKKRVLYYNQRLIEIKFFQGMGNQ